MKSARQTACGWEWKEYLDIEKEKLMEHLIVLFKLQNLSHFSSTIHLLVSHWNLSLECVVTPAIATPVEEIIRAFGPVITEAECETAVTKLCLQPQTSMLLHHTHFFSPLHRFLLFTLLTYHLYFITHQFPLIQVFISITFHFCSFKSATVIFNPQNTATLNVLMFFIISMSCHKAHFLLNKDLCKCTYIY